MSSPSPGEDPPLDSDTLRLIYRVGLLATAIGLSAATMTSWSRVIFGPPAPPPSAQTQLSPGDYLKSRLKASEPRPEAATPPTRSEGWVPLRPRGAGHNRP